jgi:hypothetical protein
MTFKDSKFFETFLSLHEDGDGRVKRGKGKRVTLMVKLDTSDRLVVAGWNGVLNDLSAT